MLLIRFLQNHDQVSPTAALAALPLAFRSILAALHRRERM